jgi:hypothetical protein
LTPVLFRSSKAFVIVSRFLLRRVEEQEGMYREAARKFEKGCVELNCILEAGIATLKCIHEDEYVGPKGALTHKDFAFKSRNWRFYYLPYSGMSDTLGLRLHLTVRESGLNNEGGAIERILPVFTDITRTKILSDFTRYCNQGLKLDRIRWVMYCLKALMNRAETAGFIYKGSLPIYKYGRCFACVSGHYISFSEWYSLSSRETETGPSSTYNSAFVRSPVYSVYPVLFSSSRWFNGSVALISRGGKAFFCTIKKACRENRFFSVGVDFTSEFPPLICKIIKNSLGYEYFKNAFFTGLMPYKINHLFLCLKGSLNLLGLLDFIEGRSLACKTICNTLNFFMFISMALKCRFDGSFLHFFANIISLLKKNSGVLSYVPSEVTCCWSFIEKSAILKKLNTFNPSFSSYFSTYMGFYFLCFQCFSTAYIKVNRNVLYLISEVSDKANFISKNLLVISNIHWSSFNSRSTEKKSITFFFKAVLSKKNFLIDGAFDFITTLARFIYNVKYYPSIVLHHYRRAYIRIIKEKRYGLCYSILVLDHEGGGISPSLVGFPVYFSRHYAYLTEIKSISKENVFRRDVFLKKSREIHRFIRNSVFISVNNFI